MIIRIEGGISAPMVPPAAMDPAAMEGRYPAFTISGIAIRPIAAAQARDEPDTAAKPEQAKMDEIANPPGSLRSASLAASNSPPVIPEW